MRLTLQSYFNPTTFYARQQKPNVRKNLDTTGAHPGFRGEILEECNRSKAHAQEFFYVRTE
jgi:hypothetical protein